MFWIIEQQDDGWYATRMSVNPNPRHAEPVSTGPFDSKEETMKYVMATEKQREYRRARYAENL